MLVYQKTMFGRYYCIKSFCHLKTFGKPFKKFILYYYNGGQKHEGLVGFEKRLLQSKDLRKPKVTELRSFLYMLQMMTSIFVTA